MIMKNRNLFLYRRISETRLFWVYFACIVLIWTMIWGGLALGAEVMLVGLMCIFYLLPVLYIIMLMICYHIGKDVQRRGQGKLGFRIGFAAFAAVTTTLVFPLILDMSNIIQYHAWSLKYTCSLLTVDEGNILWHMQAGVTFISVWAGQEIERWDRIHGEMGERESKSCEGQRRHI